MGHLLKINTYLSAMYVNVLSLPEDLEYYIHKNMEELNQDKEFTDIPPIEKEALYNKVLPACRRFFKSDKSMLSDEDLYVSLLKHMLSAYIKKPLYYNIRDIISDEWSGFISVNVFMCKHTDTPLLEGAKRALRKFLNSREDIEGAQRYEVVDSNFNMYELVVCKCNNDIMVFEVEY